MKIDSLKIMARQEIHCPHCKQLNVRYTGWNSFFRNPRNPSSCTVCGTNLSTGERGIITAIFGYLSLVSIYSLYAFIGIALMQLLGMLLIIIFSLNFFDNLWRFLWLVMMLIGLFSGIVWAETRRRKGELIAKHQQRQK
ncbi:MAG: hypothetical protein QNJ68_02120 [Microcoleaceae cyanobacterium MO_207.B10]|nr:hypothetical protein [Microcoleaceae cyanobacterium MO_207.B10]